MQMYGDAWSLHVQESKPSIQNVFHTYGYH